MFNAKVTVRLDKLYFVQKLRASHYFFFSKLFVLLRMKEFEPEILLLVIPC